MLPKLAAYPPAVALEAGARPITLKWHKLRRRREDPALSRANLEAGLGAGAVLEVDLVATADSDLVCLHELRLEDETTGRGVVAAQSSDSVLSFRQRDNAGRSLHSRVLSLGQIVEMLGANPPAGRPDGRVQLDLKQPPAGITLEVCRRFAATLGDRGGWCTLSGPSWPAIQRLAAAVPGLATGFDPEDAIEAGMAPDEVTPWARCGGANSAAYLAAPVTLATPSMRLTGSPVTVFMASLPPWQARAAPRAAAARPWTRSSSAAWRPRARSRRRPLARSQASPAASRTAWITPSPTSRPAATDIRANSNEARSLSFR